MQRTKTGKAQFQKLVNSPQTVEVNYDEGKNSKDPSVLGGTNNGSFNFTTNNKGEIVDVDVKKSVITIYKGRIKEMIAKKKDYNISVYGKNANGLSYNELVSVALGHEIDHTIKSNIITLVKEPAKVEVVPTQVSDSMIDEINNLKKKQRF